MPLTIGTRIGHYEIVGLLGAGGMGEVYRGRDTRLDRDVAIKILPDAFAADPERRARFAREAKTLAALNHPHIAHIHGLEESGQTSALVMELVDGEDLSTRIRRGPMPFEEALPIARQIADALAAAHDQGIIHRDLKPGNIKLRDDGTVKVLDFGLAKALDPGSAAGDAPSASDSANSPTITSPAMTLRGMILGTAAYMAPEQAKGRTVDKRADIWAFGCVLYEMLTGRRAFSGDDVSDTLASVLKSDADLTGVPNTARRLIRKCLEKDPRRRLQDIRDAFDLLDDGAAADAPAAGRTRWIPWALAGALLVSTVALAVTHFTEAPADPASARFQIQAPEGHAFDIYLALSPDGRHLAFTARDQRGIVQLWVRDLESLQARQLAGSEGAWSPFWSPDGRYLAFGVDQLLKKIDVAGGPPQTVAKSESTVGLGAWSNDGTIVFGSRGNGPLSRVAASGGAPAFVTELNAARTERFHSFPFFLADGRHFLYLRQSADPELHGIYVGSLDTAPNQQPLTRVAYATMGPVAVTQGPGGHRLLFPRDGSLMAQRFDTGTLTTSDESTVLAEQIGSSGSFAFFTAASRVLAYRTGGVSAVVANQLTWVDRKGQTIGRVGEPGPFVGNVNGLALSPDARHAVVGIFDTANPDLWLLEFARGIRTRLTFNDATDIAPVWSADGSRMAFRSNRLGKGYLYVKDIAGTSDESLLLPSTVLDTPVDWSHDGHLVVFVRGGMVTADLWAVATDGKSAPVPLLETRFAETTAKLSPDDRWLAYASNESGDNEVYVRSFAFRSGTPPALGPKWRVSTDGGSEPRWRRDGKELFYRSRSGAIMAADVTISGDKLQTGIPRQLFVLATGSDLAWDVAPDGQRFIAAIPATRPTNADPITVALNWQPK